MSSSEPKIYNRICSECKGEFTYIHKSKAIPNSGKPKECPLCGGKYWDKPLDEVRLFHLQDKFLEQERNPEVLNEMYQPLYNYAENFTKGIMRSRRILSVSKLHEVSHDATAQVIEKYLSDPTFVINYSFGGNLKLLLQGLLFGHRKHDKVSSLDSMLRVDDDSSTLEMYADSDSSVLVHHDMMKDAPELYEQNLIELNLSLVTDIMIIINKVAQILRDEYPDSSLLFFAGLYGFFGKKNSASQNLFYTLYGNIVNSNIEKVKVFIRQYLISLDSVDEFIRNNPFKIEKEIE